MGTKSNKNQSSAGPTTSILCVLGGNPTLLPGESEAQYQAALAATIKELGAVTPLQIYLAQKILECVWWIQRYEIQKRDTLARAMAKNLESPKMPGINEEVRYAMDVFISSRLDDSRFKAMLKRSGHSIESLRQEAYLQTAAQITALDGRIELKLKTLKGFQASYEALVNRKLHIDRLKLQNDLLKRDLDAISVEAKEIGHDAGDHQP